MAPVFWRGVILVLTKSHSTEMKSSRNRRYPRGTPAPSPLPDKTPGQGNPQALPSKSHEASHLPCNTHRWPAGVVSEQLQQVPTVPRQKQHLFPCQGGCPDTRKTTFPGPTYPLGTVGTLPRDHDTFGAHKIFLNNFFFTMRRTNI